MINDERSLGKLMRVCSDLCAQPPAVTLQHPSSSLWECRLLCSNRPAGRGAIFSICGLLHLRAYLLVCACAATGNWHPCVAILGYIEEANADALCTPQWPFLSCNNDVSELPPRDGLHAGRRVADCGRQTRPRELPARWRGTKCCPDQAPSFLRVLYLIFFFLVLLRVPLQNQRWLR